MGRVSMKAVPQGGLITAIPPSGVSMECFCDLKSGVGCLFELQQFVELALMGGRLRVIAAHVLGIGFGAET